MEKKLSGVRQDDLMVVWGISAQLTAHILQVLHVIKVSMQIFVVNIIKKKRRSYCN